MKRCTISRARAAWLCVLVALAAAGADWRQFRGSESTGLAADALPREVSEGKNVAWKVELPGRGPSGPIVAGGRVVVTSSNAPRNDLLSVLAYDAKTGARLWQRTLQATGPTACHPKSTMAAPTPASDGKYVVALFATDDLVCLDLDGNVQWVRSLYEENAGATDGRGLASSPVLVGATVVVQVETQNVSFAAGVDLRTGANRWRIDRPREITWSSPIILQGRGAEDTLVLLQGATRLSAVDPESGREVWGLDRGSDPVASSVQAGNVLYVPGEKGLAAFELRPDRAPPRQLWQQPRLSPETASPLVLGPRVYALRRIGLASGDSKSGEGANTLRLKGPFSSSPVAVGGLIYCFSEEGVAYVIEPGEKEDKPIVFGSVVAVGAVERIVGAGSSQGGVELRGILAEATRTARSITRRRLGACASDGCYWSWSARRSRCACTSSAVAQPLK